MSQGWLRLRGVSKRFGTTAALRRVDLDVNRGEILVLLGPSGCGKTTLLRLVAGLEAADTGTVTLAGERLERLAVHERGFGYVFQDYALFPHMNVRQNVAFGLRMAGLPAADREARVDEVLALVQLQALADRPVQALSGGERQRVALARSLAPAPRLLLLDEPLGALDRALREGLMLELRSILKRAAANVTAIYVTHDQAEAFAVADRVAVMRAGEIEQLAAPQTLYRAPRTPFVARFLGMENLLPARIASLSPLRVETVLGELTVAGATPVEVDPERPLILLIRPEAGRPVADDAADDGRNLLTATVVDRSFRGRFVELTVIGRGDTQLRLSLNSDLPLPEVGATWHVQLLPAGLNLLEPG